MYLTCRARQSVWEVLVLGRLSMALYCMKCRCWLIGSSCAISAMNQWKQKKWNISGKKSTAILMRLTVWLDSQLARNLILSVLLSPHSEIASEVCRCSRWRVRVRHCRVFHSQRVSLCIAYVSHDASLLQHFSLCRFSVQYYVSLASNTLGIIFRERDWFVSLEERPVRADVSKQRETSTSDTGIFDQIVPLVSRTELLCDIFRTCSCWILWHDDVYFDIVMFSNSMMLWPASFCIYSQ